MKSRLILLVGLPRSGKSTWAAGQDCPVVSRDTIRLKLHGKAFLPDSEDAVSRIEELAVRQLRAEGHPAIILDSTHFRQEYIDRWDTDEWEIETKYFNTPRSICIERARSSGRTDLIDVINMMCRETDLPELKALATS